MRAGVARLIAVGVRPVQSSDHLVPRPTDILTGMCAQSCTCIATHQRANQCRCPRQFFVAFDPPTPKPKPTPTAGGTDPWLIVCLLVEIMGITTEDNCEGVR